VKEYECLDCGLHFFVGDDVVPTECDGCASVNIQAVIY